MLFFKAKNQVILSIDESRVKLLHVQGQGRRVKIHHVWTESIQGWEDDRVLSQLQAFLKEKKIHQPEFLISHPSHLTRARALRLPSTQAEELKVMIDLQVEKHTPDAKEETLTYFRMMDRDTEGYTNVLLVMAHQDAVSRSTRMAQKLSGKVTAVGSEIEGVIHWYQRQLQTENNQPSETGGTLLIDMDLEYATLIIFHGQEAYYHRSIPMKAETLLQDATGEVLSQFLGEVHRSLMAYEEEGLKGACTRMILTGEAFKLSGMSEKIGQEMKLPAQIIRSERDFSFQKAENQAGFSESRVSWTGLIGWIGQKVAGDLTPAAMHMRQVFESKVKMAATLGAQGLLALLLVSGFFLYKIDRDMAYQNFLKQQTTQSEKPASQLEVTLEHLKLVKSRLGHQGVLLNALIAVKQATPPEVQWNTLTYTQGESLLIKGVSREMAKVFEMVTELEKSPLFLKPEAKRVTKRKVDNKDVTDFELTLPLVGGE